MKPWTPFCGLLFPLFGKVDVVFIARPGVGVTIWVVNFVSKKLILGKSMISNFPFIVPAFPTPAYPGAPLKISYGYWLNMANKGKSAGWLWVRPYTHDAAPCTDSAFFGIESSDIKYDAIDNHWLFLPKAPSLGGAEFVMTRNVQDWIPPGNWGGKGFATKIGTIPLGTPCMPSVPVDIRILDGKPGIVMKSGGTGIDYTTEDVTDSYMSQDPGKGDFPYPIFNTAIGNASFGFPWKGSTTSEKMTVIRVGFDVKSKLYPINSGTLYPAFPVRYTSAAVVVDARFE